MNSHAILGWGGRGILISLSLLDPENILAILGLPADQNSVRIDLGSGKAKDRITSNFSIVSFDQVTEPLNPKWRAFADEYNVHIYSSPETPPGGDWIKNSRYALINTEQVVLSKGGFRVGIIKSDGVPAFKSDEANWTLYEDLMSPTAHTAVKRLGSGEGVVVHAFAVGAKSQDVDVNTFMSKGVKPSLTLGDYAALTQVPPLSGGFLTFTASRAQEGDFALLPPIKGSCALQLTRDLSDATGGSSRDWGWVIPDKASLYDGRFFDNSHFLQTVFLDHYTMTNCRVICGKPHLTNDDHYGDTYLRVMNAGDGVYHYTFSSEQHPANGVYQILYPSSQRTIGLTWFGRAMCTKLGVVSEVITYHSLVQSDRAWLEANESLNTTLEGFEVYLGAREVTFSGNELRPVLSEADIRFVNYEGTDDLSARIVAVPIDNYLCQGNSPLCSALKAMIGVDEDSLPDLPSGAYVYVPLILKRKSGGAPDPEQPEEPSSSVSSSLLGALLLGGSMLAVAFKLKHTNKSDRLISAGRTGDGDHLL